MIHIKQDRFIPGMGQYQNGLIPWNINILYHLNNLKGKLIIPVNVDKIKQPFLRKMLSMVEINDIYLNIYKNQQEALC